MKQGDASRTGELLRLHPQLAQAKFDGQFTALQWAALVHDQNMVQVLLGAGTPLDLLAAVLLGDTDAVVRLLAETPGPRKRTLGNWSLLHMAASHGTAEMIDALIADGQDPNDALHPSGMTPLFRAYAPPFDTARALLRQGAEINRQAQGFTVLHGATATGDVAWVRFLLENGADPSLQSESRDTAWAIAVRRNQDAVAQVIDEFQRRPDNK